MEWISAAASSWSGTSRSRRVFPAGMEDQLGALGLVVNVMVLWTTLYMDRVLDQLRGLGATVNDEDVARLSPLGTNHINVLGRYHFSLPRLSPLGTNHINVLGRYHFSLPDAIARGEFRPLRDPSDFDDDDLLIQQAASKDL